MRLRREVVQLIVRLFAGGDLATLTAWRGRGVIGELIAWRFLGGAGVGLALTVSPLRPDAPGEASRNPRHCQPIGDRYRADAIDCGGIPVG